ncbi:MAG: phosphotransferase [Clostridia bacterium]|nr:phosphotransferase [Clostridia bacterium]
MELLEMIKQIDAVFISENATITQLKHEEDDEPYQVWRIDSDGTRYILKEAKDNECETHQAIFAALKESVPALYQVVNVGSKNYLLMEYIEGEDLCKCSRAKLTLALDALIFLQQKTWENRTFAPLQDSFERSLHERRDRGQYLNDALLEQAYGQFLKVYGSVPRALCHDDLLPFNIIASDQKAVLIDWEAGGILPYPTSFARLIAHAEDNPDALFYMTQADKDFAVNYYYDHLLREKGISYTEWLNTLEYFLFYEYCEWVFVGNKYHATDGEYYQKYFPMAKRQAGKLLKMEDWLSSV